jgi:hypothetical protein
MNTRARWLVYASAALGGLSSNTDEFLTAVAERAAKMADLMLKEEEKRKFPDDDTDE